MVVPNDPRSRLPIDQVPMYGGMDRQSIPELKKADDAFIQSTSSMYGGRERAAKEWVDGAFGYFRQQNLELAMRRFNQAWLLDPKNPEVYWGFGAILHERHLPFGSYDMQKRAYDLGFREPSFLSDLGLVAALRVPYAEDLSAQQKAAFITESEALFREAINRGQKLGYIYHQWATANFRCSDYTGAWQKLKEAKAHGTVPDERLVTQLSQKMPEPK
jgi:tetratricopeptide (TPR) repeat protein